MFTLLHFTGKHSLKHGSIALTNLPRINESSKKIYMLINAITFWIIHVTQKVYYMPFIQEQPHS